jgi:hypothetical protein
MITPLKTKLVGVEGGKARDRQPRRAFQPLSATTPGEKDSLRRRPIVVLATSRCLLRSRLLDASSVLRFQGTGYCQRSVALTPFTSSLDCLPQSGAVRRSSLLVVSVDRHRAAALAQSRKRSARGMRKPICCRNQFF